MKSILATFREKYSSLPEQGSEAWIKGRVNSIGGSDLASYLNINSYKSIKKALEEKVGLLPSADPYDPNFLWGHLWEPIHRGIIEKLLKTDIYEMGAIPYGDSEYHSRYKNSPDGVFVVEKNNLHELFGDIVNNLEYDNDNFTCGLLELKAPTTRKITDEIPVYYVPQVYSNMCIVYPSTFGLFSEIVVRRCKIDDLFNDRFTSTFYRNGSPADTSVGTKVLHRGIICIYSEHNQDKYRKILNVKSSDTYCDFGECDPKIFFEMVKDWRQDKLSLKYIDIPSTNEIDPVNLIGVCAWKCYNMSFHFVNKRPQYVEQIWPIIELSLRAIDDIKAAPQEQQGLIINNYTEKIKLLNASIEVDY